MTVVARLVFVGVVLATTASCSVLGQKSVRSSSVYCSTSRFYYLTDLTLAAAGAVAAQQMATEQKPEFYAPSGVFVTSGLIGIVKRRNCVNFREHAPPEVWAAAAEKRRREIELARAREAEAARQAEVARQQAAMQIVEAPPIEVEDDGPQPGNLLRNPRTTSWDPTSSSPASTPSTPVAAPARPAAAPASSGSNVTYHAIFKGPTDAAPRCIAFASEDSNMAACSRFCTGYWTANQRCDCNQGQCR